MSYRTHATSAVPKLIHGAIATADKLIGRSDHQPIAPQLSHRSLWQHLPSDPAPHPAGDPLLAFTFDLDYQADTDALDALVDLCAEVGVKATLFSIGKLVEADPEPYRRALAVGHEIGNHTHTHPDNRVLNPDSEFWHLTVEQMRDEIGRTQDNFEQLLGIRPTSFRTPHFKDAPRMIEALRDFPEIDLISTALASKSPLRVPYFPTTTRLAGELSLHFAADAPTHHLMVPLTACPDHRWSPFCSYHAIRQPANHAMGAGMHDLDSFASLWQTMLDRARPDGFASVYFDPLDVMRSAETVATFRAMLLAAKSQGWRITTLREVGARWRPFLLKL